MSPRRRLQRSLGITLVLATMATSAAAQQPPNPSDEQLDEAGERVEELGDGLTTAREQVSIAEQELAAVEVELREASEQLSAAEAAADEADRLAEMARVDADTADRRFGASQAELTANQQRLTAFARDSYKYGAGSQNPAMAMFQRMGSTEDPGEVADTLHLLGIVLGDNAELVGEAQRLVEQTATLADEARDTRRAADQELAAAVAARDEAAALHARVMELLDEAAAAFERQQAAVAAVEAELVGARDELSSLQEQRAAAIEAARKAAEEKARREAEAKRKAEAAAAAKREAAKAARDAAAKRKVSTDVSAVPVGAGLVSVGGITVAASLAPNLEALLEAARADGIVLGGYGYRSAETTALLRLANGCPDIYNSPASACRVPTARPGSSMHEQGLAVDFTWQGRTICFPSSASRCSGNAAFSWLSRNASRYGFYVLSSEAWHWSVNGN